MENTIKVATLVPSIKLANPIANSEEIIKLIKEAKEKDVDLLVTPELSITGASCGDLFFQKVLLEKAEEGLSRIINETSSFDISIVLSLPIKYEDKSIIASVLIHQDEVLGIVPKMKISNKESRWFYDGEIIENKKIVLFGKEFVFSTNTFLLPKTQDVYFAIDSSVDSLELVNAGFQNIKLIVSPSSDYDLVSRTEKIKEKLIDMSIENDISFLYCMPGITESTSDNVYSGYSLIIDKGQVLLEGEKFSFESKLYISQINLTSQIATENFDNKQNDYIDKKAKQKLKAQDKTPFVPNNVEEIKRRCEEVILFQSAGLARRLKQIGSYKTIMGLSGGSDSTLAFLVIIKAYEMLGVSNDNMIAITMPGFGTSKRTYDNSINLAKEYNVTLREISIKDACLQHFKDIGLSENDRSVAYENAQARERTQILMDVANIENAIVVGTGDMSELAIGWCTYNGDHMSMYNVNANIPKTLIKHILENEAQKRNSDVLRDIADTPISPELLPPKENGEMAQETENNIGPYILHDYFLYHFIRYRKTPIELLETAKVAFDGDYSEEEISQCLNVFLKRFFTNQFKRNCVPDGPKVGSIGLSPRGDFIMPSDADGSIWRI